MLFILAAVSEGRRATCRSRGTTFIRWRSIAPPSPGNEQAHLRCSSFCPITEAPAEFYSRPPGRFLLAATGLFSRSLAYGLHSSRPLSACLVDHYSSDQCLCAIRLCFFSLKRKDKQKRPSSSNLLAVGKDEERQYLVEYARTSWYHLHSPPSHESSLCGQSQRCTCRPITGATGKFYSWHKQPVSSRSFRVFFTACRHMGFPPAAHSLHATTIVTRPCDACA